MSLLLSQVRQGLGLRFARVALASFLAYLLFTPAGAADFQRVDALGIEYKNEVKTNAEAFIPAGSKTKYNFLESTVTINNTENKRKNLIVCVTGRSVAFDAKEEEFFVKDKDGNFVPGGKEIIIPARRTAIDMTFDPKTKLLTCALSQDQSTSRTRLGQMGCRQVALTENQRGAVVNFVSGNNRTTIKQDNMKWVVDRVGPVQDGERSDGKLITAGGAGAGGHPILTRNEIAKKLEKMADAITEFTTRFILSDDAEVKLDTDPTVFNCNKCFGMGSRAGDPPETRTDFVLRAPDDNTRQQAKLTVTTQRHYEVLLAAGQTIQAPIELVNESTDAQFVTIASTLAELPSACTAQLVLQETPPISLPPQDSKPATVEFTCGAGLAPGATGRVMFAMNGAAGGSLANYSIRARSPLRCDVNGDGVVNSDDIELIMAYRGLAASGPGDPFDVDHDGSITVLDARTCTLACTNRGCAK